MNRNIEVDVDTPHGKTESFRIDEAVRQGTIFGATLCGVSTSRINKMGQPDPLILYRNIKIEYPIFVDDIACMGTKKQIENAGRKMNGLEATKKFEFNNKKDKTEQMIMNFSKKEAEEANVEVRKGVVGLTELYKYLGDYYDKTGKNEMKISKKMEKAKYIACNVKRMGSWNSVGEADMQVRMMLLESIVKPTLLNNVETWCGISKKEEQMITKCHHEVLCIIFEQKQSTPYYGIIGETGIWPYKHVITYKKLMLLHHLIHSKDDRIAKQIVLIQEKQGIEKSWYKELSTKADELQLNVTTEYIQKKEKSEWKKIIKEKINKIITSELNIEYETKTKLRFLKNKPFQKEEYLDKYPAMVCKDIMELRLNMIEVKANFKGRFKDEICVGCFQEKESTEHFLSCTKMQELTGYNININENNVKCPTWLHETSKKMKTMMEIRDRRANYKIAETKELNHDS